MTLQLQKKQQPISRNTMNYVAGALESIMPYVGSKDANYNLKVAKQVMEAVIRNHDRNSIRSSKNRNLLELEAISAINNVRRAKAKAAEMVEDTQRSYTQSDANPNAKNIVVPSPSLYQDKNGCLKAFKDANPRTADSDINSYCDGIFGNAQKQAADNGRDQAMADCLADGNSQADCDKTMAELYPSAKSGQQRRKQASTEIPAYITLSGDPEIITNYKRMVAANSPIKSASEQEYLRTISEVGMEYALRRRPEAIAELRERRNESNLKSASSQIPGWARSLRVFDR